MALRKQNSEIFVDIVILINRKKFSYKFFWWCFNK